MAKKRPGLGKGLDALIPPESSGDDLPQRERVLDVPIESITANPHQPRKHFDPDELKELAESIAEHGIIQPLVLTRDESGQYTLIAGERRLKAAKIAGLERVPILVREASEQERLEVALIENVQRTDLDPLETASAYHQLAQEFGLSHEEIGRRVGKNRSTVTNTLRLLDLPEEAKEALNRGEITSGHARALLSLPNTASQTAALESILSRELNVRQTEELVKKLKGQKPPRKDPKPVLSPEMKSIQERLQASLGTRVRLAVKDREQGTITIHYFSSEELDTLLDRFLDD